MKKTNLRPGAKSYPSISIIIPTHPAYPHFKQDQLKMKLMLKETENRLKQEYPLKKIAPLLEDLKRLTQSIDYKSLAGGLAVYCSPGREKIIHLPFRPEEKLIIGKSFELRDMLHATLNSARCNIIAISENKVRVFRTSDHHLWEEPIGEMPSGKEDTGGKGSSRSRYFSSSSTSKNADDPEAYKSLQVEKYLREIDRVITMEPRLKELPMVICAPVKIAGLFRKLSKNSRRILGYVEGNFDYMSPAEISKAIQPLIARKKGEHEKMLLALVEKEAKKKHLSWGIEDAYRASREKRGRLLVVERDFKAQGIERKTPSGIRRRAKIFLPDAVDDTMENVLQSGGQVEFVENGMLEDYGRIALVTYY